MGYGMYFARFSYNKSMLGFMGVYITRGLSINPHKSFHIMIVIRFMGIYITRGLSINPSMDLLFK